VKIEAPVVIIPEKDRLWLADLGTFDIKKDSVEKNPQRVTLLEGKQTTLYFSKDPLGLSNLNSLADSPTLISACIHKMKMIVSDLSFSVQISKTTIKATEKTPERKIPTTNLLLNPFTVDLIPFSLESFIFMIGDIFKDSSRERERIARIRLKAELAIKEDLEYNTGYENWEQVEAYLENQMLHLVSKKGHQLGSYRIAVFLDGKIDQIDKKSKLVVTFRHKKIEFRSSERKWLGELLFKLNSLRNLINEEYKLMMNFDPEQLANTTNLMPQQDFAFSDDAIVGLRLKSINLLVDGYHPEGISFFIKLENATYVSKYIDGKEQGEFKVQGLSVVDRADSYSIICVKQQEEAVSYGFVYEEGSISSLVVIKSIESTYKEQYIRSLLRLVEYVLGLVLRDSAKDTGPGASPETANEISFEPAPVKVSSAKSELKVKIGDSKATVFYKQHIKSVVLVSKQIEVMVLVQGVELEVDGLIGDVGLYDLHKYPFKEEFLAESRLLKIPIIQMKKGGFVQFKVHMDDKQTKADVRVKNLMIDWVQQRAMRLIDFLMYQVLEIFYPSLFSFAKYLSRENIIRFALSLLNDPDYVRQSIVLEDTLFNLCSTVNMEQKLSLMIEKTEVTNSRCLLPKVTNKEELAYFPFDELESDVWKVKVTRAHMEIIDEGKANEMDIEQGERANIKSFASDFFDMEVEVDFLTKMFELSFLYDIVEDIEQFDAAHLKMFQTLQQRLKQSPAVPQQKQVIGVEEIKSQAKYFVQKEKKEQLFVNGRYNIKVKMRDFVLYLDNQFINSIYKISGNNFAFDDGKDELFRNTYVNSTQGLQVFMNIDVGNFVAKVSDFNKPQFLIFQMTLGQVSFEIEKKSNFINLVDFDAETICSEFNEEVGIPVQYLQFLKSLSLTDRPDEPTLARLKSKFGSAEKPAMSGTMKMYPDYRKDIEMDLYGIRIIAFNFIIRLLPELLALEPLIEHVGYEDPNYSTISILMRIHEAEVSLVSNRDSCIVVYGSSG